MGEVPIKPGDAPPPAGSALDETMPAVASVEPIDADAAVHPIPPAERYRLGAELGRGGMGRVVEAFDLQLGRTVALKEVLPRGGAVVARRFTREVQLTARLEHPSIVPLYDAGITLDGRPFYVMRRVSGRPLDQLMAGAAGLAERLTLLPAVLAAIDAVAHAHRRGVIHRDLKPANILVGDLGDTVVIDWGLAKVLGEDDGAGAGAAAAADAARDAADVRTQVGSVFGTPGFMAPEQARGEPLDPRSDVYALGATLYQLLAGVPPHAGHTATEVIERTATRAVPQVDVAAPGAPPELVAIVGKALAFLPGRRYLDAGALGEDVRRFLAGQLVAAHRYTPRQRVARFARRHRAPLAVAALAAAALAVLAWISVHRVVAERDVATAARAEAIADRAAAVRARDDAERRTAQLAVMHARGLVDDNPTHALAVLKQLRDPADRLDDMRAVAQAAVARGAAWAIQSTREFTTIAELSPDAGYLLQVSRDGMIRVWDLERRRQVWARGYPAFARAAWAGRSLLVTPERAAPELVDPFTGAARPLAVAPIRFAVVTAAGDRAAVLDDHRELHLLDLAAGTARPLWPGHAADSIEIAADGSWIAATDRATMVVLAPDGRELASHRGTAVRIFGSRFGQVGFATSDRVLICTLGAGAAAATTASRPAAAPAPALVSGGATGTAATASKPAAAPAPVLASGGATGTGATGTGATGSGATGTAATGTGATAATATRPAAAPAPALAGTPAAAPAPALASGGATGTAATASKPAAAPAPVLASAPTWAEIDTTAYLPRRAIDFAFRGRELDVFLAPDKILAWNGRALVERLALPGFTGRLLEVGHNLLVAPGNDGILHFFDDRVTGELHLPMPLPSLRLAGHAGAPRIVVVGPGAIIGFDLGDSVPQPLDQPPDVTASFVDDDTLLFWRQSYGPWQWYDLRTGAATPLPYEARGLPRIIGIDPDDGRVLVHEFAGTETSDGPRDSTSSLVLLKRNTTERRRLIRAPIVWGRLMHHTSLLFGTGDGRIFAATSDAAPREVAKLDGAVELAIGFGDTGFAAASQRGELVRGDLAAGDLVRTRLPSGSADALAADATGHILIAQGNRLLLWTPRTPHPHAAPATAALAADSPTPADPTPADRAHANPPADRAHANPPADPAHANPTPADPARANPAPDLVPAASAPSGPSRSDSVPRDPTHPESPAGASSAGPDATSLVELARFEQPILQIDPCDGGALVELADHSIVRTSLVPGAPLVPVLAAASSSPLVGDGGHLLVAEGVNDQIVVAELARADSPTAAAPVIWSLPRYHAGHDLITIAPTARRFVQGAPGRLSLWTLPLAPRDFAPWLDRRTNAATDGDDVLTWTWQPAP